MSAFFHRRDVHLAAVRVGERVAGIRQQVDEDLLELDRVSEHHQPCRSALARHFDSPQARSCTSDSDARSPRRRRSARARSARGGRRSGCVMISVAFRLLHRLLVVDDAVLVELTELDVVDHVPMKSPMLLSGLLSSWATPVVNSPSVAGFPAWTSCSCLSRSSCAVSPFVHDVDHRLAAVAQPQVRLVGVLEDVEQRSAGVVEPLCLAGKPASVILVVGEDVQHRLALVAQPAIGNVQVAHDVDGARRRSSACWTRC